MRTKKFAALLAAAAMMLGMGGCNTAERAPAATTAAGGGTTAAAGGSSGGDEEAADTTAPDYDFEEAAVTAIDPNQPTGTIKILIYHDLVTSDAAMVELFKERYGGEVEQELCESGAGYFEAIGKNVAADLSPDIVRYEWMSFPHGVSRNIFTPLDSYIDLDSEMWSPMKEIADEFSLGGKHYYVPHKLSCNFAINYNKKVLEEYGMTDPMILYQAGEWDWDAFRDMITEWCNNDPEHIGYTGVNAMSFIATTGTKLIDVSGSTITNNLENENVQRCMTFLEDICRQGLTGEGYVDPGQAFVDGNLLFLGMEPEWTYGAACGALAGKNIDFEMAFLPFPKDPLSDNYNIAYDSFGFMIPSGAKNIKGAVDWITLYRAEQIDPENVANARTKATHPDYYPKCAECKYAFTEDETYIDTCPNCGTPRRIRSYTYSEEQYDILMDMKSPENGKFNFLFDNCFGFNADLNLIFQGKGEESLLDGPIFYDVSYTQLREANYNRIESILDDYRDRLAKLNG